MQLTLFEDVKLPREVKRKAEKLMSRYKMFEAIVESKKMDLEPKMVVNYQSSESQRGNQFYSVTEKLALAEMQLDDYIRTIKKLDLIYDSFKPIQQNIWEHKYMLDRNDVDVYTDLNLTDKTYYRLKKEMIAVVVEAFGITAE